MGRLLVTLLVMGTLLALIIVGVNAISVAYQRARKQSEDQTKLAAMNSQDQSRPVQDRIHEREDLIPQLQSDESKQEQNRQLAVLYQELGRKEETQGDPASAEASIEKAIELDPKNAAYYSSLGKLFADQAANANDADSRKQLWERAATNWKQAADLEPDKQKQKDYSQGAAQSLYSYARELTVSGDKQDALVQLYAAKKLVPEDSEVYNSILSLMRDLGRDQ
jgi:tetratricopeptide (TPR) repeat protein